MKYVRYLVQLLIGLLLPSDALRATPFWIDPHSIYSNVSKRALPVSCAYHRFMNITNGSSEKDILSTAMADKATLCYCFRFPYNLNQHITFYMSPGTVYLCPLNPFFRGSVSDEIWSIADQCYSSGHLSRCHVRYEVVAPPWRAHRRRSNLGGVRLTYPQVDQLPSDVL